jgi:hypothetical protein
MASRFIAYIPKPTKEKHGGKPLYKSSNGWQIERNPVPIEVPAIDIDLPPQKCNSGDRIIVEGILIQHILLYLILIEVESLTEICNSSDNGNENLDNSEFPPIYKIIPNYWKKQQASRDLGREYIPEAVDKPVLDKGSYFIASEKSISGLDSGNSQGIYTKYSLL